MRRLNFLETVGLAAIVLPAAAVTAVGILLATGTVRIYRESSKPGDKIAVTA